MKKLRQDIRFEALVPLVVEMVQKHEDEKDKDVMESAHLIYEKAENKIMQFIDDAIKANTTHDHSGCPIPLTCTGYVAAIEDVEYALNITETE